MFIIINKYSFESSFFFNLTFLWYVETLSSDFIKIDYSVIHRLLICEPSSQTLVKYPSLYFPLITINFITLAIDIVCRFACICKKFFCFDLKAKIPIKKLLLVVRNSWTAREKILEVKATYTSECFVNFSFLYIWDYLRREILAENISNIQMKTFQRAKLLFKLQLPFDNSLAFWH